MSSFGSTKMECGILDLSFGSYGPSTIKSLSEEIIENDTIKELNLSWNCLKDEGCTFLMKIIETSTKSLKKINLKCNSIGNHGTEKLCSALYSAKNCIYLDLSGNFISDLGFYYISELLKSESCSIEYLFLSFNSPTIIGIKYLSEALKINKTLVSLHINGDILTDSVSVLYNEGIKFNETLIELDYWTGGINKELISLVENHLSINKKKREKNEQNKKGKYQFNLIISNFEQQQQQNERTAPIFEPITVKTSPQFYLIDFESIKRKVTLTFTPESYVEMTEDSEEKISNRRATISTSSLKSLFFDLPQKFNFLHQRDSDFVPQIDEDQETIIC